ncbi:TetR/AcrR family transcriptional regulator [Nannocystis pusilla]|uniref:TetR/AcrR family transcriptional regulator n=1 Tax=Nannocystis pusilla TaxID=889268 RepID=UPI003BF32E10
MTRQKIDDQRKQQIRAAATRCFVRRGYSSTRLLDIARDAGLSKGGVYFHYKAKESLFHDILDAQLLALQERWAADVPPDLPADRALAQVAANHLRLFVEHGDEAKLCNLLVTMSGQIQEYREKLERTFAEMRGAYAEIVRRGVEQGVLSGDPQVVARGIIAVIYGLAAQASVDPQGRIPLTVEQAVEQIMRLAGSKA